MVDFIFFFVFTALAKYMLLDKYVKGYNMTCKRIRIGERYKWRGLPKDPSDAENPRKLNAFEEELSRYHPIHLHVYRNDIISIWTNRYPLMCFLEYLEHSKVRELYDKMVESMEVVKVTPMGGKVYRKYKYNVVIKINYRSDYRGKT